MIKGLEGPGKYVRLDKPDSGPYLLNGDLLSGELLEHLISLGWQEEEKCLAVALVPRRAAHPVDVRVDAVRSVKLHHPVHVREIYNHHTGMSQVVSLQRDGRLTRAAVDGLPAQFLISISLEMSSPYT